MIKQQRNNTILQFLKIKLQIIIPCLVSNLFTSNFEVQKYGATFERLGEMKTCNKERNAILKRRTGDRERTTAVSARKNMQIKFYQQSRTAHAIVVHLSVRNEQQKKYAKTSAAKYNIESPHSR